jgi:excinuclease ABC subunit B
VAILDADKEGYLRSETSLIQTIGRAARNVEGKVVLYADKITRSIEAALSETERRRTKQLAHNAAHGITPQTIKRHIADILKDVAERDYVTVDLVEDQPTILTGMELQRHIGELENRMRKAAGNLEFEEAARLRDEIKRLEDGELGMPSRPVAQASAHAWKPTSKSRAEKARDAKARARGRKRQGA